MVVGLGHPTRSLKVCGLGWSFWLGWLYVTLVYCGSTGVGGLPGLDGLSAAMGALPGLDGLSAAKGSYVCHFRLFWGYRYGC